MNVKDWIDNALSQGDNVPESDSAYIDRRRRALTFGREVFEETYVLRDWPFRKAQSDLVIPAGQGYVAVPTRFESIGAYGALYRLDGSGRTIYPPLVEMPEAIVMDARTQGHRSDYPRIFALFGQDPTDYRALIQIPFNSSEVNLRLFYQRRPPKLLDAGDTEQPSYTVTITRTGDTAIVTCAQAHGFDLFDRIIVSGAVEPEYNGTHEITVTGSTTFTYPVTGTPSSPATGTIIATPDVQAGNLALNEIPFRYHLQVLLPGLKAKLRESKGDARWKTYVADYQAGQKTMKRELVRLQAEYPQLPSHFGDRAHTGS